MANTRPLAFHIRSVISYFYIMHSSSFSLFRSIYNGDAIFDLFLVFSTIIIRIFKISITFLKYVNFSIFIQCFHYHYTCFSEESNILLQIYIISSCYLSCLLNSCLNLKTIRIKNSLLICYPFILIKPPYPFLNFKYYLSLFLYHLHRLKTLHLLQHSISQSFRHL